MKKSNGITLVALVITIIILLILVGIVLASLRNSGLLDKTRKAKLVTDNAQREEEVALEEFVGEIDELTVGRKLASKVKPGDYVKYIPDSVDPTDMLNEIKTYSGNESSNTEESTLTQEMDLNWRVLDVVDGKVRLISDVRTTSKIVFGGYRGYNNAVYLLDKICNTLYNSSKYADKVQNLKREDIQNKMEKDFKTIYPNYGKIFTPATKYYPSIVFQEEGQTIETNDETQQPNKRIGISEQNGSPIDEPTLMDYRILKNAKSFTAKMTYFGAELKATDFKDSIYYDLFKSDSESSWSWYWLSSRCITEHDDNGTIEAGFNICAFGSNNDVHEIVTSSCVALSDGRYSFADGSFRPVVTLNSDVRIDLSDETKDGTTPKNAYILKEK